MGNEPKVSIICIGCEDEYIDAVIGGITYGNMEVVKTEAGAELLEDVFGYARNTDSKYISFLIPDQRFTADKILVMVEKLEADPDADVLLCNRNFENGGKRIAEADVLYKAAFSNKILDGTLFLEQCITNGINLYGNLATMMIRTDALNAQPEEMDMPLESGDMVTVCLNYLLLCGRNVAVIQEALVTTELVLYNENKLRKEMRQFENLLLYFQYGENVGNGSFAKEKAMPAYIEMMEEVGQNTENPEESPIQKKITFFYTDKGEYYNLEPISREAARRGYEIRFTENLGEKAEIGIYCQHLAFQYSMNSKFSVILLHDMAQAHNRWPDMWNAERWSEFDLGVFPGVGWAERWTECASLYWAQPRHGCYLLGYPKSEYVNDDEITRRAEELKSKFHLKYDRTVLYAPSWENDEKEDEFIRALASLDINLLIKQAHWPPQYAHIIRNIEEMRKMHEGAYENVTYIEPEESILVALKMSDMVVSDESSVMIEGLMFGIPSVAVIDWLIPDVTPPRPACVPFDCVYKCKKVELREYVENILLKDKGTLDCKELSTEYFYNAEHVNEDIMDAIEYYTSGNIDENGRARFRRHFVKPVYMPVSLWN